MTHCVIYCRVSTEDQEREGSSLSTQLAACREYAINQGWTIVAEYQETASGANRNRPKLTIIREMVKSGRVDVLLSYDIDRLTRNQTDLAIVDDECVTHGVLIDFVTERFEQSSLGKFIRNAKVFVAEVEREKIIERSKRGRRARVNGVNGERGKPLPGRRPIFGYQWADDKKSRLIENPTTARIVRRIFQEVASGASLNGVAERLTVDGIPTPTGKSRWHKPTIRVILSQTAYIGELRAFTYHQGTGIGKRMDKRGLKVKTWTKNPLDETVLLPAGTVEPLIDRATFDAVQAILARFAETAPRNGTREEEALLRGGFARCAHCGSHLVCCSHHGKLVYRCSRRHRKDSDCPPVTVRAEVLDVAVWNRVLRAVYDQGQIRRDLERMRREDPTGEDLNRLIKLLARNEQSQRNVESAIVKLDGNPDALDRLITQLGDLSKQRRTLLNEKAEVERQRAGWERALSGIDALTTYLQDRLSVRGNPQTYDFATKRAVLSWLGVQVSVKRTFPGPYRKGSVVPRPVAEVVADQPYEMTARIPLDRPGPWDELAPYPVDAIANTTESGNGRCRAGRRTAASASRSR
jgi:site-specific DNA recombinase